MKTKNEELVNAYTQYNNYCVEKDKKPISFRRWKNINAKLCSHCGLMLWACGCGGHCFPELTGKEEETK